MEFKSILAISQLPVWKRLTLSAVGSCPYLCIHVFVSLSLTQFSEGRKTMVSVVLSSSPWAFPTFSLQDEVQHWKGWRWQRSRGWGFSASQGCRTPALCYLLNPLRSHPLIFLLPQPTNVQWSLKVHTGDWLTSDTYCQNTTAEPWLPHSTATCWVTPEHPLFKWEYQT